MLAFYGFFVLLLGTITLAFEDELTEPLFGVEYVVGNFYRHYSLALDLFGVALIAGLAIFAVKRGLLRPRRLDYRRPDRPESRRRYVVGDWVFLGALLFLAVTGFMLEALRVAGRTSRSTSGRPSAGPAGSSCATSRSPATTRRRRT